MMETQLHPTRIIPMGKRHRLPEIMTKQELIKFSRTVKRVDIAMAVWISIFHGLRVGEITESENKNWHPGKKQFVVTRTDTLKWENVNLQAREIKVVNGKNTKRYKSGYGKDRIVPIPKELVGIWKRWKLLNPDAVYVIPDPDNPKRPITKKVFQTNVREYLKSAGLEKVHYITRDGKPRYSFNSHTFRHMFGVNMIRKGVSIEKLQKLMGHARIETTMIYTKLAIADLHTAVDSAFAVKKENPQMNMAKEMAKAMMSEMMANFSRG